MDPAARQRRWRQMAALVLVLLAGAALRLYRLPELPLGLHYDEAANGILASEIASGLRLPVFIRAYTGKEVLFFYWASLWMRLVGPSTLAIRVSAAAAGLMTVAAAVWSAQELLHGRHDARRIGLLTGAFLATSFWHVVLSRYAFRAVTQPLLQALTAGALWRGLRLSSEPSPGAAKGRELLCRRSAAGPAWLIAAGLLCGLTAYTYLAARAFPVPLGAGLLALLVTERRRLGARVRQAGTFVGAAALALAPLAVFWATNPGSFLNRAQQVAASTWREAWDGFVACLGMLFVRGDPYVRFNIPDRPLFGPLGSGYLLLGVPALIWWCVRLQRTACEGSDGQAPCSEAGLSYAACVFLLVCVPVMLLPSALATGEVTPSNLRAAGLLPFVYLLPSMALSTMASGLSRWTGRLSRSVLWVALVVVGAGSESAVAYFRDWAPSAALYYAADGDLVDVATYLNQADQPPGGATFVASTHYRHPTLAFLARNYGGIRWLTGGSTVVLPAAEDAVLVVPRSASRHLPWMRSVLPADALVVAPPGPDGQPAFHVLRVPPALSAEPSRPQAGNVANVANLIGYDVIGEPVSGGRVDIAAWWKVQATPVHGDLGPVARLTDAWGSTWGETSSFHYPGEQWVPGDVIVDLLSVPSQLGAPPGDYVVRLSLFSAQVGSSLPVLDADGRYGGFWLALPVSLATGDRLPASPDQVDVLVARAGARHRIDVAAGELALLGVALDTTSLRPGERLRLALFWRAAPSAAPDYTVVLALGDLIVYRDAPVHGTYPFTEWEPGLLVADRYDPRLPRDTPPGDYVLRVRLRDSGDGGSAGGRADAPANNAEPPCALDVALGTVTVRPIERSFAVPLISRPYRANLGQRVELLGYDLSAATALPGETISLTLYWRALAEMDEDYTVFVHLLGPSGAMAGQHDGQPVGGAYPTSLWVTREVVVDTHEVAVHSDASGGAGRLLVGMYVADSGARLANAIDGSDALDLGPVIVGGP